MRLGGRRAAREFVVELWSSRGGCALFLALTLVWAALAALAAWGSRAAGLGESWGPLRQGVSWAGAATQVFLALAIPLVAAADDVGPRGGGHGGGYGGCHGGGWGADDEVDLLPANLAALVVLVLDLGRFAGPWAGTWAPEWLSMGASWWWLGADAVSAAIGAALWAFVGCSGLAEVGMRAVVASPARWLEIERGEIESASKPAKRRDSGPKRL